MAWLHQREPVCQKHDYKVGGDYCKSFYSTDSQADVKSTYLPDVSSHQVTQYVPVSMYLSRLLVKTQSVLLFHTSLAELTE